MTIETTDLEFAYEGEAVLRGVDFRAETGEVTVLLGRNGAGKSTLLKHLNGLEEPDDGAVYVDGDRVRYDDASLRELRTNVGYVFQNPDDQLVAPTVGQDVAFGPENVGADAARRSREALETVGLTGFDDRLCTTLSGGEKKRVSLAGVLAMEPDYLIFDEPTLGLDGDGCAKIAATIEALRDEGITVVVATHDLGFAMAIGDVLTVLEDGEIVYRDTTISRERATAFGLRTFAFDSH